MAKKIGLGIAVILCIVLIVHGFFGKTVTQRQTGTLYYLNEIDGVMSIFRSDANTKNEQLIYTHKGKSDLENQNVLGYYYEPEENCIYFIALTKGEDGEPALGQYRIVPGEENATFVKYDPEYDGSGKYREYKIRNTWNNLKAESDEGNLILYRDKHKETLKKFSGIYDAKDNKGFEPLGISPDGDCVVYTATAYRTAWGARLNRFLSEQFHWEDSSNSKKKSKKYQTNIIDISTKNSSKFVVGKDIQWIPEV